MGLDKKLKILNYLQFFATFMACVYFVGQMMSIFKPFSVFMKIDPYLGLIPSLFNNIFPWAKIPINDREVPAGYIITAVFCIVIYHIINKKVIPYLESKRYEEEEKERAKEFVAKKTVETIKKRETVKQVQYKETFYGLFELKLGYYDDFKKNDNELEKLRLEYYKIFANKLRTKYARVEFLVKDKIFFVSNSYNLMHPITVDIMRILDIVVKISRYNSIKINILFSYWIDKKTAGKMNIFRTLSQINALNNTNKIILSDEVYAKIMSFGKNPWCKANSLGSFRLFNAYNGEDTDVELYEISYLEKNLY